MPTGVWVGTKICTAAELILMRSDESSETALSETAFRGVTG
jgi:hypothetical protein